MPVGVSSSMSGGGLVLRDATNRPASASAFNRESAKASLAAGLQSASGVRHTSAKLISTLTALKTSERSMMAMRSGARRVPVAGGAAAAVAHASAAPIAATPAAVSSDAALVASLREQLASMQEQVRSLTTEKDAALAKAAEVSQQLQSERERSATLVQRVSELEAQLATAKACPRLQITIGADEDEDEEEDEEEEIVLGGGVAARDDKAKHKDSELDTTQPPPEDDTTERQTQQHAAATSEVCSRVLSSAGEDDMSAPIQQSPASPAGAAAVLPSVFSTLDDELPSAPASAAKVAPVSSAKAKQGKKSNKKQKKGSAAAVAQQQQAADDEFVPVTMDDMNASLGDDAYGLAGPNADESAASLNLSAGSALGLGLHSPTPAGRGVTLPASFCTPRDEDGEKSLSPIAVVPCASPITKPSPSPVRASRAATMHSTPASSARGPANAATGSLTNSALKLQAFFRGKMERAYLASGEEARLASLPLTSPSTPASKRPRMRASPVAMRGLNLNLGVFEQNMGDAFADALREEADGEEEQEAGVRRMELEDDDEQQPASQQQQQAKASGRATTRIPSAAASSIPTPTPIAAVLASSDDASSSPSASSFDSLPPGQPLSSADSKRLQAELKAQRPVLASLDACWTLRSKTLNRVEELARERGLNGLSAWPLWRDELQALQRPMGVQLTDLRSSIVREACRTLIALCDASPREFEEQLSFYVPTLCKSLYVTIKAISHTADETLAEIIARGATPKSVPLLLSGLSDAHAVVREKCGRYLLHLLGSCKVGELESHWPALSDALRLGTQDADGSARKAWRACLDACRRHFPASVDALVEGLPPAVQKAIESERRGGAPAPKTARSIPLKKRKKNKD